MEHELVMIDGVLVRSGRVRRRQFAMYPRPCDGCARSPICPVQFR